MDMARPERFELPTAWFVARYSIQLSYGRVFQIRADYTRPGSSKKSIKMTLFANRHGVPKEEYNLN